MPGARVGHVVLACDSFKGTRTAQQVGDDLRAGLLRERPELEVFGVPVADGGEGTVDAALRAGYAARVVHVTGPLGDPVDATVAVRRTSAVVELAAASGLALGVTDPYGALRASSAGTGQLIRACLDLGARHLVLGLGGSAVTDGGAGMLQALGATVEDGEGLPLGPGGASLSEVGRVDLTTLDPRLRQTEVVLAADVDNPLLGPTGAARAYAPQKGADPPAVARLEAGLRRWSGLLGADRAGSPGAGAAGGVGFAALVALQARRRPGVDVVLELVGFADALTGARLVVTGEGCLDEQTLRGKTPVGVAAAARARGVPVVAVCGRNTLSPAALRQAGFAAVHALTDLEPDLEVCRRQPGPLLHETGRRLALAHLPG